MRVDIENSKDQILSWIDCQEPKAWICRQLKCRPDTLNSYLKKWGVQYVGAKSTRGKDTNYVVKKLPIEEYLGRDYITSHNVKLRLYSEGLKTPKCEICEVEEWLGQPLSMHLHHIDGDRFNNQINNLQILCPNCHAQTDSYAKPLHKRI